MKKIALIFGVTGQDGAYLSKLLLKKNYIVHGVKRRSSSLNTQRIDDIYSDFHKKTKFYLHYGDLTDSLSVLKIIKKIKPNEIYNLGAQSHVGVSFEVPEYTANVDGLGTLRILDAILTLGVKNKIKFYQAGTSEMFGASKPPQNERTNFYPRSPYAAAKLYAHWITVNYREAYGIFGSNGILFNHESPRRGGTFVTRKITVAACRMAVGLQSTLYLGNLDAKRDWGHAKDYVRSMWMILQHDQPDDFVISTGVTTSVRDFVINVFRHLGVELEFFGAEENEHAKVSSSSNPKYQFAVGQVVVKVDEAYYRPTEVELLLGDSTKAKELLGWEPEITLDEMIEEMVDVDLQGAKEESAQIQSMGLPRRTL